MSQNNCPYYGHFLYGKTRQQSAGGSSLVELHILPTLGNQCALIFDAHSPCQQEIAGKPIDWRICPVAQEIRPELSSAAAY